MLSCELLVTSYELPNSKLQITNYELQIAGMRIRKRNIRRSEVGHHDGG